MTLYDFFSKESRSLKPSNRRSVLLERYKKSRTLAAGKLYWKLDLFQWVIWSHLLCYLPMIYVVGRLKCADASVIDRCSINGYMIVLFRRNEEAHSV